MDHHIGFMFKAPERHVPLDMIIAGITGAKYVHVDILFVCPEEPREDRSQAIKEERDKERREYMNNPYTAYMHERFSGYHLSRSKEWLSRTDQTHALLLLSVTQEEFDKARQYVTDLCVHRVPYNYSDLFLCGAPDSFIKYMVTDVDPYPIPNKVYCSQACILMLKHIRNTEYEGICSRACSPMMLYNILSCQQASKRVQVSPYVRENKLLTLEEDKSHFSIQDEPEYDDEQQLLQVK